MKLFSKLFIVLAGFAFSGNVMAAGNIKAGEAAAKACAACHGADGNSSNPSYPSLAGRSVGYLTKQMEDFKSGKRKNGIMQGMMAPIKAEAIKDIAAYYNSLIPVNKISGEADPETLKMGRKIFHGGNAKSGVSACMSCHGPSGHGIPPRFPRLNGQHAAYTQNQLIAFRDEKRENDDTVMQAIAVRMTLKEITAVSEYIARLK